MRYHMAVIILALSGWAHAYPLGQPDTTKLFKASDIVFSGTVTTIKEMRPAGEDTTGHRVWYLLATIRIDDLYKGNLSGDRIISVEFTTKTPVDSPGAGLSPGEHALLFLKEKDDRTFVFADKQFGAVRFSSVPAEPGSDGLAKFEAAMTSVFVNGETTDREYAADLLLSLDRLAPSCIAKITPAAMAADPTLAQYAIALLIKRDNAQGLEQLKRYIAQNRIDTTEVSTTSARMAVSGELSSVRDGRYLKDVEELSFADNIEIRMGAVQALRNMETRAAAPAFVKHLDDPDKNIRYSALMALAIMYGKTVPQVPNWPEFDQRPDYYTGLWKAWAQQTGITIAQ
jgi:hypothetical protein